MIKLLEHVKDGKKVVFKRKIKKFTCIFIKNMFISYMIRIDKELDYVFNL